MEVLGGPLLEQWKQIQLATVKFRVLSLASLSGLRIWRCHGVGRRCSSDLALLWLWHRPAAVAPIQPLAWDPPCAVGTALKRKKKKKRRYYIISNLMAKNILCICKVCEVVTIKVA